MSMATQLGIVVIYNEELSFIKLHDPSVTRSCEMTQQIKCVISPFALDQWPPNMKR